MRALGADAAGARGWAGVVVDGGGFVAALLSSDLEGLVRAADALGPEPVAAVGVDIPIGAVDGPRRAADVAARAFVGVRRSSVFWTPHRSALAHTSQAAANAHLAAIGMPKVSAQAMALFPRIREAAALAAADRRLVEVFPEASFRAMAGHDLPSPKRSASGALHRVRLLAEADPSIVLPADPALLGPAGAVALDDLFDAAAASWSALRVAAGTALALGDPDEVDAASGRRIAVWV